MMEERLKDIFNQLVEELDLGYGNAGFEYFDEDGRTIGIIEAPNNTTLTIDTLFDTEDEITDEEIRDTFLEGIEDAINNFDPELTFEEIWHRDFEYSAFEFVDMLREDEEFFSDKIIELEQY